MTDLGAELNLLANLVIMGVDILKEEITYKKVTERQVSPTFLEIFPKPEGEGVPSYLDSFQMWAFMDGFKIYSEKLKVLNDEEESESGLPKSLESIDNENNDIKTKMKIYSFVMTDQMYCKRYCTTLLFHERYYVRKDEAVLKRGKESTLMPKSSLHDMYVKYPYTMNDHDLIYLPKSVTLVSMIPCFDAQKQILRYLYENLLKKDSNQPERNIRIPRKFVEDFEALINKKKIEQSDVQIDDAWLQNFSYDRAAYLKGQKKGEENIIKETILREFYISVFFSMLDLSNGPVERVFLKLHSEENEEELVRYRINKSMGVDLPLVGYKPLFRRLSPKNIVKIFQAILLEKQIIFFSSLPGEIPYITEAFLSLVSPMLWCCIYIPYMPISVWEYVLHAIMPCIVGIPTEYREFLNGVVDLKEKVIVDLDNDTVQYPEQDVVLPPKLNTYLTSKVEELSKSIRNIDIRRARETWVEVTLKCRNYFNIFLLELINNVIPYFRHTQEQNIEKEAASEIFHSEEYLESFPDNDTRRFVKEMLQTMMFNTFIEECYVKVNQCEYNKTAHWEDQVDEVSIFLHELKKLQDKLCPEILQTKTFLSILHPKSIAQIETDNNIAIQQATQRYFNPQKIDLLPYLIKYYYKFMIETKVSAKSSYVSNPVSIPLLLAPTSSRGRGSPVGESPIGTSTSKETLSLNKGCQVFPPLNKAKILDLKKIYCEKAMLNKEGLPVIRPNGFKLSIFAEAKPVISEVASQIGEEKKSSADMAFLEPPADSPEDMLRKSNYFLYYQMVKRNEILSPEVKRLSEYDSSFNSPEKRTFRAGTMRPSYFFRDSIRSGSTIKPFLFSSTSLPIEKSVRTGSFMSKKTDDVHSQNMIQEEKHLEEVLRGLGEGRSGARDAERNAFRKALGVYKGLPTIESESLIKEIKDSSKNFDVLLEKKQSGVENEPLQLSEDVVWAKTRDKTRAKAKLMENNEKPKLERSVSVEEGKKRLLKEESEKVYRRIRTTAVPRRASSTKKYFSASPSAKRRGGMKEELPKDIRSFWEDNVEFELYDEEKERKKEEMKEESEEGKLYVKNLDTGEMIPVDQVQVFGIKNGKDHQEK